MNRITRRSFCAALIIACASCKAAPRYEWVPDRETRAVLGTLKVSDIERIEVTGLEVGATVDKPVIIRNAPDLQALFSAVANAKQKHWHDLPADTVTTKAANRPNLMSIHVKGRQPVELRFSPAGPDKCFGPEGLTTVRRVLARHGGVLTPLEAGNE
jgi:hypothetical protein